MKNVTDAKLTDDLVFTVVRDPVRTAISAFAEIDLLAGEKSKATYKHINCTACPNCRYRAFLRSLLNHEKLGNELFHAFPQTIKTGTVFPVDAVVHIERLNAGLKAIAAKLHTMFVPQKVTAGEKHSHALDRCWANIKVEDEPDLLREVCRLYSSDFTCFGYERPETCAPADSPRGDLS